MTDTVKPIPDGYHTVTPYLLVEDAPGILSFIERAFGGKVLSRHLAPDGRVAHAEVQIGDSRVMLSEAREEWPAMPAMLHLYVEDVDAVYGQAVEAGGTSIREPEDMSYGDRSGGVRDAAGNQWWIATHIKVRAL
ncbi:MAG: VOC family protein [Thermoanaerobaculia bacterium]